MWGERGWKEAESKCGGVEGILPILMGMLGFGSHAGGDGGGGAAAAAASCGSPTKPQCRGTAPRGRGSSLCWLVWGFPPPLCCSVGLDKALSSPLLLLLLLPGGMQAVGPPGHCISSQQQEEEEEGDEPAPPQQGGDWALVGSARTNGA